MIYQTINIKKIIKILIETKKIIFNKYIIYYCDVIKIIVFFINYKIFAFNLIYVLIRKYTIDDINDKIVKFTNQRI